MQEILCCLASASTAIAVAVVATAAHQDDDPEDTVAGAASKKAGSIAASAVVAASATIVASTATVVVTSTVCSSQITHYKILQLFVYNSFYVDRLSGVPKYPVAKETAMGYNTRVNTAEKEKERMEWQTGDCLTCTAILYRQSMMELRV